MLKASQRQTQLPLPSALCLPLLNLRFRDGDGRIHLGVEGCTQGQQRGEIAAARAPDVLCSCGAPSRPQQSCSACRSRGPPRRRRPPRASGPWRCVKTCNQQTPTGESTTSAAPCAPKTVSGASGRALGWLGDSPPRPAWPLRTHPPQKLTITLLQRAPLAQPSAPKTLVVWVVCCSILTLFSRGSCAQRVR